MIEGVNEEVGQALKTCDVRSVGNSATVVSYWGRPVSGSPR